MPTAPRRWTIFSPLRSWRDDAVQATYIQAINQAMRELILAGMESQSELPELPPPPEPAAGQAEGRRSRGGRRRHR